MSELIEGKVAQILSDKYLIINVGSAEGVTVGMPFVVLMQGDEVKDPASGKTLGRWELPKGYVRVTHTQELLATCEACSPVAEKGDESRVLSAAMIDASVHPESWGGTGARLDVNRSQLTGVPRVPPISVGDTVRQMAQLQPQK